MNSKILNRRICSVREVTMSIQSLILIMDNVKFHDVNGVGLFSEGNNIRIKYLPPYSRDLNPFEYVFGTLKGRYYVFRPCPQTNLEIRNAVLSIVNEMNTDSNLNFNSFYDHMRRFFDPTSNVLINVCSVQYNLL